MPSGNAWEPPAEVIEERLNAVSVSSLFGAVLATWLVIGATTGVVMGRRGHAAYAWTFFGAVLGPLVLPLAAVAIRNERDATASLVATGAAGRGPVDVLVGIDGSPEASAAARAIVALVADRLGRCTLAWVLDFDTATTGMVRGERERAAAELGRVAALLHAEFAVVAETVLLTGRPADALASRCREERFTLMAIGRRGSGASTSLLGSVAGTLAREAPAPVLIVGDDRGDPRAFDPGRSHR